ARSCRPRPVSGRVCARASRAVGAWRARGGPVGPRSLVVVSSPGLERALKWHRHWVRLVGRTITVRLEGLGRVRARILAVADEATVVLQPEGGAERTLPLAAVRDARLAAE